MDVGEVAVAEDAGIGIIDLQRAEQGDEGCTLGRSSGVSGTAFLVKTTFVTNTNRVGIVVPGMGADHLLGATEVQLSVAGDVVMITAAVPAFGTVHLVKQLETQMLVRPRCRAVNHNQIYSTHSLQV